MKLVEYDKETKDFTIRMTQRDFLDLFSLTDGVANTPSLQDFTALGVIEDRVDELSTALRTILEGVNISLRR